MPAKQPSPNSQQPLQGLALSRWRYMIDIVQLVAEWKFWLDQPFAHVPMTRASLWDLQIPQD